MSVFVTYSNLLMLDYIRGFPAKTSIYPHPFLTILELFTQSCEAYKKHNFIKNKGYNKVIVSLEKQEDFYEWYNTMSIHLPSTVPIIFCLFYYYECPIPLFH